MGSSYKEMCNEYKNQRRMLADDLPIIRKKKKRKQVKKSNHKHKYRPMIFMRKGRRLDNTEYVTYNAGFACEICGRVDDFYFLWGNQEEKINYFKLENPNYIEVELPED